MVGKRDKIAEKWLTNLTDSNTHGYRKKKRINTWRFKSPNSSISKTLRSIETDAMWPTRKLIQRILLSEKAFLERKLKRRHPRWLEEGNYSGRKIIKTWKVILKRCITIHWSSLKTNSGPVHNGKLGQLNVGQKTLNTIKTFRRVLENAILTLLQSQLLACPYLRTMILWH